MKIIDLLNKIANGEEVPEKIKIFDTIFKYSKNDNFYFDKSAFSLSRYLDVNLSLNDEVELIEEKKIPEKINKSYNIRILDLDKSCIIKDYDMEQLIEMVQDIYEKQDEIIDYLKNKGDE